MHAPEKVRFFCANKLSIAAEYFHRALPNSIDIQLTGLNAFLLNKDELVILLGSCCCFCLNVRHK
jgi:hypothetical protein